MSAQGTTHTPGPWHTAGQSDNGSAPEIKVIGKCGLVALCRAAGGPRAEARANARLIAAAPRMLEALQRIDDICAQGHSFQLGQRIIDITRALLRDVEGESNG